MRSLKLTLLRFLLKMRSLVFILKGVLFILLVVGLPVYFFTKSLFITKMVILSIVGFYLGFLSLVHWLKRIFPRGLMSIILDGISTILIVLISLSMIIILRYGWLILLNLFPKGRYKYSHIIIGIILFLLGIRVRFEGKFFRDAKLVVINHTAPIADYLLMAWCVPPSLPYNVVAGKNLTEDKDNLEGKVVSWLIGKIIKDFLIQVNRKSNFSKGKAFLKMKEETSNGKIVVISPEDGRLPMPNIRSGMLLKEKFTDSAFEIAFENHYTIQLAIFDWPAIWRGKDDHRFGIHPTIIKTTYISVNPENFNSVEELKEYCYNTMLENLRSSKNVQRFLKELQVEK